MTTKLTRDDFIDDAKELNCEIEAIMAVAKVESGALGGFYSDGHPVILFEPHIFHKRTQGKFGKTHPHLSYPSWNPKGYGSTAQVRARFNEACILDKEAACWSTSWGLFQIMGFHHNALGFATAVDMAEHCKKGENEHLWLFTKFVKASPSMNKALQNKDWATFARLYNGAGYKANNYDVKMENEYKKLKG